MKSYRVRGFKRDDHSISVSVIIDGDHLTDKFAAAEAIAGPDYCLVTSENIINCSIPDAVKNRLLTKAELYAAVPELNPQRRARRQPSNQARRT